MPRTRGCGAVPPDILIDHLAWTAWRIRRIVAVEGRLLVV